MKIRKAENSDALNIAALGMCVWVDTYATEGVFDKISRFIFCEFTEKKILEIIKNKTVFIATIDKCITGYMVLGKEHENRVEIETLYILPKFHRTGIGKQLVKQVLKSNSKTIWLSVWELNQKAIRFYLNQGFKEKGEIYFDLYGDKVRNIILEIDT